MKYVSALLLKYRDDSRLLGKEISAKLGLPESYVSDVHNGKRQLRARDIVPFSELYGIKLSKLVKFWLIDVVESDEYADKLLDALSAKDEEAELSVSELSKLKINYSTFVLGKKILNHVESIKRDIIHELANNSAATSLSMRESCMSYNVGDVKWTPIFGGSKISKSTVFVTKRPSPLVVELHKIPQGVAAMHRMPKGSSYYEIWSIVRGAGYLVVQEQEKDVFTREMVAVGMVGAYQGSCRHLWVNTAEEDLITTSVVYPYRQFRADEETSGEYEEVCVDKISEASHQLLKLASQVLNIP